MRLDKYVAHNAGLTRKAAQQAIKAGKVRVDSAGALNGAASISPSQTVTLNGIALHLPEPIYWMLHKPEGYVCANHDAEHPTVFDLVDTSNIHPALRQQLQVVGRLDKDTTGLVLITSDGQWNHRITAPTSRCTKCYRVGLANAIAPGIETLFADGIQLKNEAKACAPAELIQLDNKRCELRISEGKYHQVKRMFAAVGNRVITLHRAAIGAVKLDENLKPGEYRDLTKQELASF